MGISVNLQLINTLYKQIISSSPGAERIKIDLHVHTPASHDFVYMQFLLSRRSNETAIQIELAMIQT